MHTTIKNLLNINENVNTNLQNDLKTSVAPKIIAVSKTFKIDHIMPLIDHGHLDYGENKVQEAIEKWTNIKNKNKNIKLHLIGGLQTNKVKFAVRIFDYIHSLDNQKLADSIADDMNDYFLRVKKEFAGGTKYPYGVNGMGSAESGILFAYDFESSAEF